MTNKQILKKLKRLQQVDGYIHSAKETIRAYQLSGTRYARIEAAFKRLEKYEPEYHDILDELIEHFEDSQ